MFKFAVVIFAVIACAAAKPGLVTPLAYTSQIQTLAYTAPAAVVAAAPAPFVTVTSSQYVARNYNGIATAPIVAKTFAAPVAAAYTAPVIAKTFAAPVAAAYNAPVVTKYTATYAAPFGYSAPLTYAAAPAFL
ncbi:uncharacterized protein [Musca autumnalis]|uniref:uncharacterized protein n=1 Tax=Musca autumnalis TaxID=221902 RepID=UPI003CECF34C